MQWPGFLIYLCVVVLWAILFSRSFWLNSIWAWSAGIAYIFYDTVLMLIVVWQTLPFREQPAKRPLENAKRPSLGIIIAAHNEAKNLPTTLAAIFQQSDSPEQILIVDDGSTDSTCENLARVYNLSIPPIGQISEPGASAPTMRLLRLAHTGKATALNTALSRIDTDIVITLDADTFLAADAISEIREAFASDDQLVAACGVLVPLCNPDAAGHVMQWFQTYEYVRNIIARFAWMRMNSLLLISGAFAGFRRSALVAVGGFDPNCLVEDYELTHRMHRYAVDHGLAWQLKVIGTAIARTEAPSTVGAFLRQRRRWFGGFLQTQYWNRDMIGNHRYGALGKYMLPIKAVDTFQPIYGLTGFALLMLFVFTGNSAIAIPVIGIVTAKIAIDFVVYLWTVHLYRRLTGGRVIVSIWSAAFAAIFEPFSFQLLRHAGAAWGWIGVIRGDHTWGTSTVALPSR